MSYSISMSLPILLILYTLFRISPVYGILPWCGLIDYALVDRNYTTINATKNQKLCYQTCLNSPRCKSANYRPKEKECDLNSASHFDVCEGGRLVEQSGSLYTFTASERMGCDIHTERTNGKVCKVENFKHSCGDDKGPEWQLVFKGAAEKGIKLYDLWTNTTWDRGSEDYRNYRNETLFNAWNDEQLNIKQVKMSLYDQTGVKVELVFNGTDSDSLSWFAKERLVSSPWRDLTTTATTNYFSITGRVHPNSLSERRFYISKNHGGCHIARGWLVVVDKAGTCSWFKSISGYPAVLYSTDINSTNWHDAKDAGTLGKADYLTIHINTE